MFHIPYVQENRKAFEKGGVKKDSKKEGGWFASGFLCYFLLKKAFFFFVFLFFCFCFAMSNSNQLRMVEGV